MGSLARVFRPDTPQPEFIAQLNNYTKTLDNQNRFEIIRHGESSFPTITVTGGAAGYYHDDDSTIVTHNLGFAPVCWAFVLVGGVRVPLNYFQSGAISTTQAYWWNIAVLTDNTRVVFRSSATVYFSSAGDATLNGESIQYYLLRATAGSI